MVFHMHNKIYSHLLLKLLSKTKKECTFTKIYNIFMSIDREYIFHLSIFLFTIMVDKMELRNNFFCTSLPMPLPLDRDVEK